MGVYGASVQNQQPGGNGPHNDEELDAFDGGTGGSMEDAAGAPINRDGTLQVQQQPNKNART